MLVQVQSTASGNPFLYMKIAGKGSFFIVNHPLSLWEVGTIVGTREEP